MVRLGPLSALAVLLGAGWARAQPGATLRYRGLFPGELLLIAVEGQAPGHPPSGRLDKTPLEFLPVSSGTYLAFAALDLEISTGAHRIELRLEGADGKPLYWGSSLAVQEKKFPSVQLKVAQNYVTPKPEDDARAEKEWARLRAIFAGPSPERLFDGNFVSPIPRAVSARFGERRVYNGVPKSPHTGADLRANAGTPVRAPAGGRAVLAEGLFFQGNTVLLDHGGGLFSYYCHLSKISVRPGREVRAGEVLGEVGATGRVTGPHLHWAMRLRAARVDPFSLVAIDLRRWLPAAGSAPEPLPRELPQPLQ